MSNLLRRQYYCNCFVCVLSYQLLDMSSACMVLSEVLQNTFEVPSLHRVTGSNKESQDLPRIYGEVYLVSMSLRPSS